MILPCYKHPKVYFVLISLLFLPHTLHAQKSLTAIRTSIPFVIDGKVDSFLFQLPDSASFFVQMEPDMGSPASEKTVAYLVYDDRFIYFAALCYQDPTGIVGKILARDNLSDDDDAITLILDTYNDRRTGFGFTINPLGTMTDFRIGDDGRILDLNWDEVWESSAKIYDWGWYAEFAIPLASLSYNRKLPTWGFNIRRMIRYNFEVAYWSGQMSQDYRLSQGGRLSGIQMGKEKGILSLYPYATVRYEDSDYTGVHDEFLGTAGMDIKYQFNSYLTANVAINPDFATVEGDQEQINLTRYELSYPEKRLFFQEGNDMFKTRIRNFYSRRIGDVVAGGKLTGKAGKYNMNFLGAQTFEYTDYADDSVHAPAFYSAGRVKRDILKSSTVGLTFADKSWDGGYARSLGADYMLNLGKTWKLTGQYVGSAPGSWLPNSAWFVRFARENNVYHYHIRYSDIGESFMDNVNQTGYVPDEDRREVDIDLSYKWWLQSNTVRYIDGFSNFNSFWSHQGYLRGQNVFLLINTYFQNKLNFEVFYNYEYRLFEKDFYNYKYGVEVGYNTDEWSQAKLNYWGGRNFDRNFYLFKGLTRFKITQKFAFEYSFNLLKYDPDPTDASTFLNVLSASYNFTRDLWIQIFAQNNSAIERFYFYGKFGWRFKPPFGAVYLVYTHDEILLPSDTDRNQEDILYLKVTYPIVFNFNK